ncbi:hypothetical protein ACWFMI_27065 [Nocardiopsis terrae]
MNTFHLADAADETDSCNGGLACEAGRLAGELMGESTQSPVKSAASEFEESAGKIAKELAGAWFHLDIGSLLNYNPGASSSSRYVPKDPPSAAMGPIESVLGWVSYISLGLCVISLIALGASLALRHHRAGPDHASKIGLVFAATILITVATQIAQALMTRGPSLVVTGPAGSITASLWWYISGALILSVMVGGARIAWEQRAEPAKQLLTSLLTMLVVTGAGASTVALLAGASDEFARFLFFESELSDENRFTEAILNALGLGESGGSWTGFGPLMVLLIALVAVIVCIVQICLLIIRDGMLVALVAVLPLAAAFTNTEMGKQFFKKTVAWIIAFLLYKPAAAILYTLAIKITGQGNSQGEFMNTLVGLGLLVMSLVAMPALMRLVVPAASLGGGNTAATALSGGAAFISGPIASGAIDSASQGGNDASQAPAGGTGGSGADPANGADGTGGDSSPAQGGGEPSEGADQTGQGQPAGTSDGAGASGGADAAGGAGGGEGAEAASGAAAGGPAAMVMERLEGLKDSAKETGNQFSSEATGGPDGY